MSDPKPDKLRDKAIAFIQSPPEAQRAVTVIIEMLATVDGYAAIPQRVQTLIEQRCTLIYASGFIRGVRKAKEIEKDENDEAT